MLQVHKVTPWWVECEAEKCTSFPASCLESVKIPQRSGETGSAGRFHSSRLPSSQTVLSQRCLTFIMMSCAATKTGAWCGRGGSPRVFWCATAGDERSEITPVISIQPVMEYRTVSGIKALSSLFIRGAVTCERPSVGGVSTRSPLPRAGNTAVR